MTTMLPKYKQAILVDLDDTLVYTSELNNDAYNFALEALGFERINSTRRITREYLSDLKQQELQKIISLKQKYFTHRWMKYRLMLNDKLLSLIKKEDKNNCFIWTKAEQQRAIAIYNQFKLNKYFKSIIFDSKNNFNNTKKLIMLKTNLNNLSL